jgi:DNA primase
MTLAQEIKTRIDIVDLISGHVPLERSGRNFKAACPFHDEKTASFFVFPEKQTWRCFGACADGGDLLSFVMKADNIDFSQTLGKLADQLGLKMPSRTSINEDNKIYELNDLAVSLFQDILNSEEGSHAREYLRNRNIKQTSQSSFQIGLSPNGRDRLVLYLHGKGYAHQEIIDAGLATRSSDGQIRDMFQKRIMFPIHNASGQITGFGGRSIDNTNPKYINTPKSKVFDKGALLYGLYFARNSIATSKQAIIVEGYLDVITAHQNDFQNVVASMGTALTDQQVKALRSLSSDFILALDPDNAGKEATLRSLESSWHAMQIDILRAGRNNRVVFQQRHLNVSLKVAELPVGQDPDALIQSNPAEWERLIKESTTILDYLFKTLPDRYDTSNDNGKLMLVDSLGPFIKTEANPFTQRKYLHLLSEITYIDEVDLQKHIWQPLKNNQNIKRESNTSNNTINRIDSKRDVLEEYYIFLLMNYPDLSPQEHNVSPDMFEQTENRGIFTNLLTCSTIDELKNDLIEDLASHLDSIMSMEIPQLDIKERFKSLKDIANRLKARFFTLQEQILLEQLNNADWTSENIIDLHLTQTQHINHQLRQIYSGGNTEREEPN